MTTEEAPMNLEDEFLTNLLSKAGITPSEDAEERKNQIERYIRLLTSFDQANHSASTQYVSPPLQKQSNIDLPEIQSELQENLNPFKKPHNFNLTGLSSLNLHFDGQTEIRDFLDDLELLKRTRCIPENLLLNSFADLLRGTALLWYKPLLTSFKSWTDLKTALLERFGDECYEERILELIKTRSQKSSETMADYIDVIRYFVSKLTTKPSEEFLLKNISKNARTEYRTVIGARQLKSIQELLLNAKNWETLFPLNLSESSMDKIPKNNSNKSKNNKFYPKIANVEADVVCLKCKSKGHTYRQCTKIKYILCFNCGLKGNLTKDCSCRQTKKPNPSDSHSKNE
jgi:hypothetical protein